MSSEEDEFFDAPDAFACSPNARRWSDNEDDLPTSSLDFDSKNARRRSRVESLKRTIDDHKIYPHFVDPMQDIRDFRRVSLTDSKIFGLRTPTGLVRSHRSAYTQPHESFFAAAVPGVASQDATDHSASQVAPYSLAGDTNGGYIATQTLLGHQTSPDSSNLSTNITSLTDRLRSERSSFCVPIDQLFPLPVETDPSIFPKSVFTFGCSRQFSLPMTNAVRAPVIYSAPEVSDTRITTDSNALMEYVKSWSLDAAKRQAEGLHSVRVLPNVRTDASSAAPQLLGEPAPETSIPNPVSQLVQLEEQDPRYASVPPSNQTSSCCPTDYCVHRPARLVSTMVQTNNEDLNPRSISIAAGEPNCGVSTVSTTTTGTFLVSHDKTLTQKSATLHDERILNPIELHFRSFTTSNASLTNSQNVPVDCSAQTTNAPTGKKFRLQRYLLGAVNAMRSATRAKIFTQNEESSDEDDEVIGNQGIRIRSSRQARGRREFLQVKLVQEMKNEHTGAIWAMRFSPCGRLLATAGYDRNIRVWVLRQWYSFFKRMQQSSVESVNNPEFGSTSYMSPTFTSFENTTSLMDDENLLDSISLASTSASTAGRTDDGTSTCSSNPACPGRNRSSPVETGANRFSSTSRKLPDLERGRRTVFRSQPLLVYRGHEGVVTELVWSKNLFLLATSMDHQVRLWHISRRECLCLFSHNDTVPTIVFHPKDDRFFLSGSLDGKLRLWNIPDKKVRFWVEVPIPSALPVPANASPAPFAVSILFKSTPPSTPQVLSTSGYSRTVGPKTIITSAAFACDGTKVVVGTYDGRVMFFSSELTYITFIAIKSSTTKGRQCRVTAIELDPTDSNKILVTSNDSRLRLIDARDYHTLCKYRGFVNETSQIRASFSPTGRYLISGSENTFFYIWQKSLDVDRISRFSRARKDRNNCWEAIKAHDTMVTVAIFCPNPNLILDKRSRHGWPREEITTLSYMEASHIPRLDELPSHADPRHPLPYLGELIVSADCNGCIRVFKKVSASDSQSSCGGNSRTS
ncbi:WD repeat-containing protein 44 [Fasciola gigantica]|uniref:WD repeat-containing protein 44 n=1 Tax=Fasciola gigantica TaxID=46835 RepID=A0A504YLV7_FASGI|nr:WD repeat-containing protein 44 [Fasciola gigantica]